MHRQYLHIGNRTIAYYDSAPGEASAKVAVLVHAFPLSGSMWEPQFKNVPAGWRLIAPDMRGFGGSTIEQEPESPSMDDYAVDIVDLLHELAIASAVIGGCSMGGYVTFAVLRAAPRLARGLILADTRVTADTSEGRANRRSLLAILDRQGASGIARDMLPKLLGKTTLEQSPTAEANLRRVIKQQATAAIRGAVLRMMNRPDSTATLSSVTVPALIVVGEEDTLTPVADAQKLAAAIPNAELVIIPRAGHLASLEQPEPFNLAMSSFLSRL
jgi:pimeloyl-ACP methyl ester carboxylesterase